MSEHQDDQDLDDTFPDLGKAHRYLLDAVLERCNRRHEPLRRGAAERLVELIFESLQVDSHGSPPVQRTHRPIMAAADRGSQALDDAGDGILGRTVLPTHHQAVAVRQFDQG